MHIQLMSWITCSLLLDSGQETKAGMLKVQPVTKHMSTSSPRKIAKLEIQLHIAGTLDNEQKKWLIAEATQCPVALSADQSIEISLS